MKPSLFLRIAATLSLAACLGHTFLFLTYAPKHGPEEAAVIDMMKAHSFRFSGHIHTYWELYFGYGLFVAIACFIEFLLLWQLSALSKDGARVKQLIASFALGEAGYAFLMFKYFFAIPIFTHIAITVFLVAALLTKES